MPLGELAKVQEGTIDKSIYRKNQREVVYVTADMAGAEESPVYAIGTLGKKIDALKIPEGYGIEQFTSIQPPDAKKLAVKWDGEWHITYEVFRDLGLAFAAVLVLIYVLVVGWFKSFKTPLVIMAPIPLTLVGILPAHATDGSILHRHFNDRVYSRCGNHRAKFDHPGGLHQVAPLARHAVEEAVVDAGAVRFRPMF